MMSITIRGALVRFMVRTRCTRISRSFIARILAAKQHALSSCLLSRTCSMMALPRHSVALYLVFIVVRGSSFLVQAIAPPHPNYIAHPDFPYESLHTYRNRNNITYNYVPQHISPRHCRFLTETQCARDDEAAFARISQNSPERRLQEEPTYVTQGKVKILVLLMRFKDHQNKQLPDRDYYDQLFNGGAVNPVGSLGEWLYANSAGQYDGARTEYCMCVAIMRPFPHFLRLFLSSTSSPQPHSTSRIGNLPLRQRPTTRETALGC